jgi:hypothetical protein
MLLLCSLIFRAVAIEFRSKEEWTWWRQFWDVAFSAGSLVASLLIGVAMGNIVRGIPLDGHHEFAGSFLTENLATLGLCGFALSFAAFVEHKTIFRAAVCGLTLSALVTVRSFYVAWYPALWIGVAWVLWCSVRGGFQKRGEDISVLVVGAQASLKAGSFEVGIRDATLGALVKPNGTVALQATGTPYLTLPSAITAVIDLQLKDLSVSYNTTGAAVDQTLTAGTLKVPITVASGGTADPYLVVGGSASMTIGGFVNISGSFGFARRVDLASGRTAVMIGAADVRGSAGSDEFTLTNGDLGLVLFEDTASGKSLGYALDGSVRGIATTGGLSAAATVRIRRNSTRFAVDERVPVQTWQVPVLFSLEETATAERPFFSSIGVENAVITIGDITIRGSYKSLPGGSLGESITDSIILSCFFRSPLYSLPGLARMKDTNSCSSSNSPSRARSASGRVVAATAA